MNPNQLWICPLYDYIEFVGAFQKSWEPFCISISGSVKNSFSIGWPGQLCEILPADTSVPIMIKS